MMATRNPLMSAAIRLMAGILRIFFSFFYDKKYLRGRYFDSSIKGWWWAARGLIWQKLFLYNRAIPWPVSLFNVVSNPKNIVFDVDDIHLFQGYGKYFHNSTGMIIIGKGTEIAPNVGLITANHDPKDLSKHLPAEDIVIGKECWIGMNSTILPGVVLGDRTMVGAGSVVTKSFPKGSITIAGNPAKAIKGDAGVSAGK